MLNERLRLTRPLILFDLETTSLDVQTARIVEIGFQQWTANGLQKEWKSLVNPGVPITNSDKHHVTDLMVHSCRVCNANERSGVFIVCSCDEKKPWPTFPQLAESLARGFSNCDFAGKNVRYDLQILANEMIRARVAWSYVGAYVIDADRLEALGEPRDLSSLYRRRVGREPADAHHALADVQMTAELLDAQLRDFSKLPRDLSQLHELQWPGFIDAEGKFRFDKAGIPRCAFGKHRDAAMRDIPQSYYRWMAEGDFSAEVKALAKDAQFGKFPGQVLNYEKPQ